MRLAVLIALLVLAGSVTGTSAAAAFPPDSDAPHGAPWYWLPDESWVDARWLPFEEERLREELGYTTYMPFLRTLRRNVPLRTVALRRGRSPSTITARLLAGRGGGSTPLGELQRRTWKILTQPHLAAHMFTHHFHNSAITRAAPAIFGISPVRYVEAMEPRLLCPLDVGRRNGRTREHVLETTLAALRSRGLVGVHLGAMPRPQADASAFSARAAVDSWLTTDVDGKPLR